MSYFAGYYCNSEEVLNLLGVYLQILKVNPPSKNMKTLNKILYFILAISLLPAFVTYFAYGSILEMFFCFVTLIVIIGLFYLIFPSTKKLRTGIFLFTCFLFLIQLYQLKDFWFNNQGGDFRVTLMFTLQSVFMLIILVLMWNENKKLKSLTQIDSLQN
jgi:hypothetical protein